MTDRPILFSGAMVRALLAGTKAQTRRVLNPQPEHLQVYDWKGKRLHDSEYRHWCWKGHVGADNWDDITKQLAPFLPFASGDRLYVREAWRAGMAKDPVAARDIRPGFFVAYEADGPHDYAAVHGRLRQGMHMPRWASRLTLTVTGVHIQRLQEISEADARAEGYWENGKGYGCFALPGKLHRTEMTTEARPAYAVLWDSLNAERAGGAYAWAANPWVVAVTFNVIHQNIDQVPA